MELWKDIPEYEGRYQVSNCGRIRNADGRVLRYSKPTKSRAYCSISFKTKGKPRHFLVHRLVAEAFCARGPGAREVNHKNGNKEDNRAVNLEWCTRLQNVIHAGDVLDKKHRGKPVRAEFDDGRVVTFLNQRAAEVSIAGGDTGFVSLALKTGRKAYGASWSRA